MYLVTNHLVSIRTPKGTKPVTPTMLPTLVSNNPASDVQRSKIVLSCVCEAKHPSLNDIAIGKLKGATIIKSLQSTVFITTWRMLPPRSH